MQYTWNDIERHVAECTHCALSKTRRLPVMGCGDRQACVMLIAEAPGGQEDQQGTVFVGSSGGSVGQPFAGLWADKGGTIYYQYCEMPSAREPGPEGRGEGGMFPISEV